MAVKKGEAEKTLGRVGTGVELVRERGARHPRRAGGGCYKMPRAFIQTTRHVCGGGYWSYQHSQRWGGDCLGAVHWGVIGNAM